MAERPVIVAIDGPAGAGKSSSARGIAKKLGFLYLDSGSLYRAVAWKVLNSKLDPEDAGAVGRLCLKTKLEPVLSKGPGRVMVDGNDVTGQIRTPEVSRAASVVAANPAVRDFLLNVQRRIGEEAGNPGFPAAGIVAEGRDIGTVVFPGAGAKFFLEASPETRVKRRSLELRSRGFRTDLAKTRKDLDQRDSRDIRRELAPLKPAADAVRIDSTNLDLDGVMEKMIRVLKEKGLVPAE